MPRDEQFISASEIGTWCYCHKAWRLSQQGRPSSLIDERTAGIRFHEWHSQELRSARQQYAGARVVMLICAIALALIAVSRLWIQ
jgi:hypothetical protein